MSGDTKENDGLSEQDRFPKWNVAVEGGRVRIKRAVYDFSIEA